jgi:plastocyanin
LIVQHGVSHQKEEIVRYRDYLSASVIITALLFIGIRPASAAGYPNVSFVATDYAFSGPDSIQAGLVSVHVLNKGKDLHHIQFLRLDKGKTLKDFVEAAKADPHVIYGNIGWVKFEGGPNAAIPGTSSTAVMSLEPGQYVVACIIPSPKGVPHVNLGMVKALTVKGPATAKISEPKASVTITAHDFNFSPDKPIKAGPQTIRFNNAGTQPHEVLVVQLPPGKTMQDFAAGFAPGATGPPPGKPIGGLTGVYKGGHEYFTANFTPGHYGLICFFEDAAKKAPHFALGMTYEFDVH